MIRQRVGTIGVGHLGTLHARMLAQIEEADLVGVYDRDPARAQALAAELGIVAYPSAEALIADVECLTVATTTGA